LRIEEYYDTIAFLHKYIIFHWLPTSSFLSVSLETDIDYYYPIELYRLVSIIILVDFTVNTHVSNALYI